MLIYVVTKDSVVMHITTDFDEAEIVATGYVACAQDQVLEKRRVANEIVFNGGEIDMAEAALLAGWGDSVEIYEADTDDAVLEVDEGINLTLREIREKLGQ